MKTSSNIFWMGIVSFFTDFASSLVMPILPIFVVLILNQGVDKLGLILAITTIVSYLLRFVSGVLSDKYQMNKPFLMLGYGLSAMAKPFLGFSDSWTSIVAVRSSERLGKALRAAPKDKLLSISTSKARLGRDIGIHKAIEKSGELLGLVTLFAIIYYFGTSEQVMRNVFSLSIIPGLLSILVLYFFVKEKTGGKPKKRARFSLSIERQARKPIFAYSLLTLFMFNEAFFLLIGDQMGITLAELLIIYIASRALQIVISLKAGKLISHWALHKLLLIGCLSGFFALILLLPNNTLCFVIAFLLLGIYDVITLNSIRSYIGQQAIDKGATFGSLYFIVAITSALGAYILSLIWQHFDSTVSIQIASIGILLSGSFILYLARQQPLKL